MEAQMRFKNGPTDWWPEGYQEPFEGISIDPLKEALKELSGDVCIEIGCGDGYWTNRLLVPKFKQVYAVDIIDEVLPGFNYLKQDCLCSLPKCDAAYSFGVFCHLPISRQSAYLRELRPLLKGKALISFANFDRHPSLVHIKTDADGWFYNNIKITKTICENEGFKFTDFDPSYRDTIAILE
jgi:hypothetical protein